jgi:hypothetical protein
LALDHADGAAQTARGYLSLRYALDGAEGDQIAKAIKTFAPTGSGRNEPQPLPIAKAAYVNSQNALHFPPRISLWQLDCPRFKQTSANDYAPDVNPSARFFGVKDLRPEVAELSLP